MFLNVYNLNEILHLVRLLFLRTPSRFRIPNLIFFYEMYSNEILIINIELMIAILQPHNFLKSSLAL